MVKWRAVSLLLVMLLACAAGQVPPGLQSAGPDQPVLLGESATTVGATAWHRSGFSGDGVDVAVVDLGFDGYRLLRGTRLPADVTAVSFRRDGAIESGTNHGTAAAELIHAVAPGASLHLIAYDGDLWSVVDYLIDEGVDVVSFSIGYLSGPFDGTSPVARAVQWALDEGIVWVAAAGNYALRHWGGVPEDRDDDGWLDIAPGVRIDPFTAAAGAEFDLHLSWLGDADLDLCLFQGGRLLTCADQTQAHGDRPIETLHWTNRSSASATFGFGIRVNRGEARRVDVFADNVSYLSHRTAAGSIVVPGDVEGVITVGAVTASDPTQLTATSSRGPTADGRPKPDLVAPAGVPTSIGVFAGTSAATPHVAGIAALLLEAYPATPPDRVGALLRSRARPLGDPSGYGAGLARVGSPTPACAGLAPTILGTQSNDVLNGTSGPDVIHGRGGDDVISGGGGDDVICGGPGSDILSGGAGVDRLLGGAGEDVIQRGRIAY